MKKINKFFSLLLCTAICFEMIQIISYAEDSTAYGGIIGETIFYEEFDSYLPYDITSTNSQAGRQPLTLAIEDDEKANDGKSMTCKGNGIFSGTATVTIPFREKIETADSKIEVIARIKPIYLFGTTASTGTSQKYFYERFMQINGTKGGNGSNLYSIYNASWTNSVYLLDWKTRLDKYYSVLWGKENTTADFPENPEYVTYKYAIDGENNECTISYSKDEKNYTDMVKYTPSEMPDILTSVSIGSTLGMSYAIDYVKVTAYKNNNIYVSPNGDDSNPGKIDSPLATLDGARKKAVKLRKSIGDEPINVYFRGGDYTFNSTVEFSELDSGSENASVTYSAYKGETVNFKGSVKLNSAGFEKVDDDSVLNKIPEYARNNIWKYDLKTNNGILSMDKYEPAQGYSYNALENGTQAAGLYVDGNEQLLSRYPNGTANYIKILKPIKNENAIYYSTSRAERWVDASNAVAVGGFTWNWAYERVGVSHIDTKSKKIYLENAPYFMVQGGEPEISREYAIENLIEELDIPGEYYVDESNMVLYFCKPYDISNSNVELAVDNISLMNFNKSEYITFKNINFENVRRSAAKVTDGKNIDFCSCTFKNIINNGVLYKNCYDCTVDGCDFSNIGGTGVEIGGGDKNTLTPGNNTVKNSMFSNLATKQKTISPGIQVRGVGNSVLNNVMHDSPHTFIFFEGNDNKILYNELYNGCKETDDSGAIYAGQTIVDAGNEVAYNYIHDINTLVNGSSSVRAVYLDDMFSGTDVHHNIIENVNNPIALGGGMGNAVHDNIIVNNETNIYAENRGMTWQKEISISKVENTVGAVINNPAYEKYGYLKTVWESDYKTIGVPPYGSSVRNNLLYNSGVCDQTKPNQIKGEYLQYADVSDNYTTDETKLQQFVRINPLEVEFVNASNGNYAIKSGSQILSRLPGLSEISLDNVGLYIDEYRKNTEYSLGEFNAYYVQSDDLLVWNRADNADYYRITAAKDAEFKNIITQETSLVNRYKPKYDILSQNGKVYYKIDAVANGYLRESEKSVTVTVDNDSFDGTYSVVSCTYDEGRVRMKFDGNITDLKASVITVYENGNILTNGSDYVIYSEDKNTVVIEFENIKPDTAYTVKVNESETVADADKYSYSFTSAAQSLKVTSANPRNNDLLAGDVIRIWFNDSVDIGTAEQAVRINDLYKTLVQNVDYTVSADSNVLNIKLLSPQEYNIYTVNINNLINCGNNDYLKPTDNYNYSFSVKKVNPVYYQDFTDSNGIYIPSKYHVDFELTDDENAYDKKSVRFYNPTLSNLTGGSDGVVRFNLDKEVNTSDGVIEIVARIKIGDCTYFPDLLSMSGKTGGETKNIRGLYTYRKSSSSVTLFKDPVEAKNYAIPYGVFYGVEKPDSDYPTENTQYLTIKITLDKQNNIYSCSYAADGEEYKTMNRMPVTVDDKDIPDIISSVFINSARDMREYYIDYIFVCQNKALSVNDNEKTAVWNVNLKTKENFIDAYVAAFNENGTMTGVEHKKIEVFNGFAQSLNNKFEYGNDTEYVKLFIWDKSLTPILNKTEVKRTDKQKRSFGL